MHRIISIQISDAAIASCLEYSPESATIEHAVSMSIEFLTQYMRAPNGYLNSYTDEELIEILKAFNPHSDDEQAFQAMGELVEKQINESATADIAKPLVMADKVENVISAPALNLYDQRRKTLNQLKNQSPTDPYILELLERLTKEYKQGDLMQEDHRLEVAAVELVYSNLPIDMWSGVKARLQIQNLIRLHKEANK